MSNLSVTNTFVASTTAVASQVNTNFSDIVNYVNDRNSGSQKWDSLAVLGNSVLDGTLTVGNVPIIMNFVSVKSYGAIGSGLVDDTAALQAALSSGNKNIFIPAGTYNFTTLTIGNNITIFGAGSELSELKCTGSSGIAIELGTNSTRVIIKGLKIAHANSANTLTAIHAQTIREFKIDEYAFEFFKYGIQFEEPVNCIIGQGRFTGLNNTTGTGLILGSTANGYSATATDVRDAYFSGYAIAVSVEEGSSNRIRSIFENCGQPILVHASYNARTYIYTAHFENNVASAILIKATGSAEVLAIGVNAYEGSYVNDWGPKISGNVSVFSHDQIILGSHASMQIGHVVGTGAGTIALKNATAYGSVNAAGNGILNLLYADSDDQTTIAANTKPVVISQAATQSTIGINGVANALTANPVGYLKVVIAGVTRIIPYYTA